MSNSTSQPKHLMTVLIVILMTAIIVAAVIYVGVIKPEHEMVGTNTIKIDGVVITPAKDIDDFHLTDTKGNAFSKAQLKGHWTFMFFGFTNCSMVCPATMVALSKTYKLLLPDIAKQDMPQVVMVSVDPERDTLQKMQTYVTTFHPDFIGTRGNPAETTALEKQLHIVAIKKQAEGDDKNNYYYDHSAEILLFNPEGKLQAYLSYPHNPEQMAKDYKLILKKTA